ncbi:hypothetical protein [Synechococcus sp. MIT S9510]|uniref:hypothetical protein n=1 Tax=unclassified Synechococcus TaxID=2626047 RepID=UPI0039AF04BD
MGAFLDAVVIQQNNAASEWLADGLAKASQEFTVRKIVFMGPARRARDALHAVGKYRGDALLLSEGSELDDSIDVGTPRSQTLAWLMSPDKDPLVRMAMLQNRVIRIDAEVVTGFLERLESCVGRDEQDLPRLASIAAFQEWFAKRN